MNPDIAKLRGRSISVVIPVLNEEENVFLLHERLAAVASQKDAFADWEFIFVDDGSSDGTWPALVSLHQKDRRLRAIRLARRFGQTDAMACGIRHAKGEVIVTMDGDLQNDPQDIPLLVSTLGQGFDVVCGWRRKRKDSFWNRTLPSMVANMLIGKLTGIRLNDYGCSLKAYRAEIIQRTPLYAELHRFIPALTVLTGAVITEVPVRHHPRVHGKTKYSLARTWRVTLDMVTVAFLLRFSANPLRFFGWMAALSMLIGAVFAALSFKSYGAMGGGSSQVFPSITVLLLWLSGQAIVLGLFSELYLASTALFPRARAKAS